MHLCLQILAFFAHESLFFRCPFRQIDSFSIECHVHHETLQSSGYQEPGRCSAKNLSKECYTLHPDDEDFISGYQEIDLPFQCRTMPYFKVVGSCNGVIVLCGDCTRKSEPFIFWNPCIRKAMYVPKHRSSKSDTVPRVGFGFDQRTNNFKLVQVCGIKDDGVPSGFLAKVEVFSVRGGCWMLTNTTHPWHDFHVRSQCYLNGSIHWLFYDSDESEHTHYQIVTFDLASETFEKIILPKAGGDGYVESIMVYKGMLALVRDFVDHPMVWVMNEYGVADSWSKLVSLEHSEGYLVFGFRSKGEMLYLDPCGYESPHDEYDKSDLSFELSMLFTHQPGSGVVKYFGKIFGIPSSIELIRYVPTLALLKEGNTITACRGERHGQLLSKVDIGFMYQKVEEGE